MRSENEPVLLVYDQRTRMMALVLSLASSAPLGLTLAFAGDLFQIIPFELTYFPIMLLHWAYPFWAGRPSYLGAAAIFAAAAG